MNIRPVGGEVNPEAELGSNQVKEILSKRTSGEIREDRGREAGAMPLGR